jgi:hypothetical protein
MYWELLAAIVFGVVVYALVLNRMAKFAQPIRLRMADRAAEMLADSRTSKDDIEQIHFYMRHAFSVWLPVVTVFLMPALFVLSVFPLFRRAPKSADEGKMSEMSSWFTISVIAANPLFGAIMIAEFVVIVFLLVILIAQPMLVRASLVRLGRTEVVTVNRVLRAA